MTLSSIPQTFIQHNTQIVKPTREQADALRAAGVQVKPLHNGAVAMMRDCPTCGAFQRVNTPVTGDEGKRNLKRSIEIMTAADCPDCHVSYVAPAMSGGGSGNGGGKSRKQYTVKVKTTKKAKNPLSPEEAMRFAVIQAKADTHGISSLTQAEVKELSKLMAKLGR